MAYLLAWVSGALSQQMDEVWGTKFAQCHEGFGTGINRFVECLFRNPVIVSGDVLTRFMGPTYSGTAGATMVIALP